MGEIVTVNFRGDQLYGFKQDDGAFLAVKPICDAMGLLWEPQRRRLLRDPVLSKATTMMVVPFSQHGGQEVTCLKLEKLNFFLAGVDSSRIKDEAVRAKVILYQEECADVLFAHFTGKAKGRLEFDEPEDAATFAEGIRAVAETRHTFSTQAARELWFKLGLPVVPSMIQPEQADLFGPRAGDPANAA